MTRCRWRLCDRPAAETFTVCAPGFMWNRQILAPGDTLDLCPHHSETFRGYTYEHELPDGCGSLPGGLRMRFDVVTDLHDRPTPAVKPKPSPRPRHSPVTVPPAQQPPTTVEITADLLGDRKVTRGQVLSVTGVGTANGRYRVTRIGLDGTVYGERVSIAP